MKLIIQDTSNNKNAKLNNAANEYAKYSCFSRPNSRCLIFMHARVSKCSEYRHECTSHHPANDSGKI